MTTAQLLNCLGNTEIYVTRWGKTKLVGGKHKASKKAPFKVLGTMQPVNGRERETLPEGRRQSHVVKIYVEKKLLTSDDQNKQRADILTINKEDYEVIVVEEQRGLGLNHFKVFAARLN